MDMDISPYAARTSEPRETLAGATHVSSILAGVAFRGLGSVLRTPLMIFDIDIVISLRRFMMEFDGFFHILKIYHFNWKVYKYLIFYRFLGFSV